MLYDKHVSEIYQWDRKKPSSGQGYYNMHETGRSHLRDLYIIHTRQEEDIRGTGIYKLDQILTINHDLPCIVVIFHVLS